jgi:hypothetical protein
VLAQRTVDQAGASASVRSYRVSAGVYEASDGERSTVGLRFGAGRHLGEHLDVSTEYFTSRMEADRVSRSLVTTLRQTLSPRLTTSQVVSTNDGRTSLKVGGSILSNLASISVDYQNSYAPFAGRSPFVNTLVLSARLNTFRDWQVQVSTYTLPNGSPRYTVSASRFFYRARAASQRPARQSLRIPKYLVQGRVVDEGGNGVSGAVLDVGGATVITGEDGRFFARFDRRRSVAFTVSVSEFSVPYRFSVISSPDRVTPGEEGNAAEITVVVRRRLE